MRIPILVLCLGVVTTVQGEVCLKDQFWSPFLESCEECSKCVHPDVVVRPCQGYRDTICGPLSDLNIDWTWLKKANQEKEKHGDPEKEMLDTFRKNLKQIKQHEAHVLEKQKHQPVQLDDSIFGIKNSDPDEVVWEKLKGFGREWEDKVEDDLTALEKQKHADDGTFEYGRNNQDEVHRNSLHLDSKEAMELLRSVRQRDKKPYNANDLDVDDNEVLVRDFGFSKPRAEDVKMDAEFSSAEKFVLDWQTIIVAVAVAAILIFFIVAAVYSLQGKYWRKLRHYFDADVEELQSWLSNKDTKEKLSRLPSSGIYKTTTEVVHTDGQCKYLERIINLNGQNKLNRVPSNVYSDRSNLSEVKPLCRPHDDTAPIHKQFGDHI